MVIVPSAGDCFGKQNPAYGLLRHTRQKMETGMRHTVWIADLKPGDFLKLGEE